MTPFLPIRCNRILNEMTPISIYEESQKILSYSMDNFTTIQGMKKLMQNKDTYELSIITCFCGNIDKEENKINYASV